MDFSLKVLVLVCIIACTAYQAICQPIEIRTYHDEQKTIIKEIYFISDRESAHLDGPYQSFFINGTLEKEGFYSNNLPDSTWTYYYESGVKKMKGQLKQGTNHGIWEYYFENGHISMAGAIVDSKRTGNWKYYYENNNLKSEGKYVDGIKEGIWNYFYEEGELKAQAFYNNGKGKYKEFYHDGKLKAEGINVNGKSDSTWVFYHDNGQIEAVGDYVSGRRSGPWIYYHDNGIKSAEGNFTNGEKEGNWIYYHENGNMSSEGALHKGRKEGYWKIFGDDGVFKAESVFSENNGKYTEYYPSGKVKADGNIEDGKNHGLWTYYYEDGTKEGECDYLYGDGQFTGYYKDGKIKMKGDIKDGINVGLWELYKEDGSLAGYYRPYYEDSKPVYKLVDKDPRRRGDYVKPEYKFKSYKSRYFDPVINEYRGTIFATNPLATLIGQLPLSFEYYIQERLGYEVIATLLRDPFYKSAGNVELNKVFKRGASLSVRQKYYHPEGKLGMFYFGHELRFTSLNHDANTLDSLSVPEVMKKITARETRFEYALFVGDRWLRLFGEGYKNNSLGLTIDAYLGFGFGYRIFDRKYAPNPLYDEIFKDINDSKFVISPRIGLNLGFVF